MEFEECYSYDSFSILCNYACNGAISVTLVLPQMIHHPYFLVGFVIVVGICFGLALILVCLVFVCVFFVVVLLLLLFCSSNGKLIALVTELDPTSACLCVL